MTLKVKFARKQEQTEVPFQSAEREQTRQYAKFQDFQQITRSVTVDYILRTKEDILPLAKQLMGDVEFHSHPIRLLGLGVANQKSSTVHEDPRWVEIRYSGSLTFRSIPNVSTTWLSSSANIKIYSPTGIRPQ